MFPRANIAPPDEEIKTRNVTQYAIHTTLVNDNVAKGRKMPYFGKKALRQRREHMRVAKIALPEVIDEMLDRQFADTKPHRVVDTVVRYRPHQAPVDRGSRILGDITPGEPAFLTTHVPTEEQKNGLPWRLGVWPATALTIFGTDSTADEIDVDVGLVLPREETDDRTLAERNPVPIFDGKVHLYETGPYQVNGDTKEAAHTYVVKDLNGREHDNYTSSTTFVKQFHDGFNARLIAPNVVKSKAKFRAKEYYEPTMQLVARTLLDEWHDMPEELRVPIEQWREGHLTEDDVLLAADGDDKLKNQFNAKIDEVVVDCLVEYWGINGKNASGLGTEMHECFENYFTDKMKREEIEERAKTDEEFKQFLIWHDNWLVPRMESQQLTPYRMELTIFDPELKITGSIDALFRIGNTDRWIMVDWKRSKEIKFEAHGNKKMSEPISHLIDCNHVHYCLQQNLYRAILARNTNIHVVEMYLAVFHPRHPQWELYHVPVMDAEIDALFKHRRLALQREAAEQDK
jgi:hypothetical protein